MLFLIKCITASTAKEWFCLQELWLCISPKIIRLQIWNFPHLFFIQMAAVVLQYDKHGSTSTKQGYTLLEWLLPPLILKCLCFISNHFLISSTDFSGNKDWSPLVFNKQYPSSKLFKIYDKTSSIDGSIPAIFLFNFVQITFLKSYTLALSKSGSLGLLDVSSRSFSTSGNDLKLYKVALFSDMPTDRHFCK